MFLLERQPNLLRPLAPSVDLLYLSLKCGPAHLVHAQYTIHTLTGSVSRLLRSRGRLDLLP